MSWRSLLFFCKKEVFLLVDDVKISRLDQRNLQNGRQNSIQFSKNDHRGKMKISERAKLFD